MLTWVHDFNLYILHNFMKKIFAILFAALLSLSSYADTSRLASIGSEEITPGDFWQYVGRRIDLKGQVTNTYAVEKVLHQMLATRVLELEGENLGVGKYENAKISRFDDLYADIVYKKISKPCVRPSEEDQIIYFRENREKFKTPESVRLWRVMLPVTNIYDGKSAIDLMASWVASLARGDMSYDSMALLAQKYDVANVQGDLGWLNINSEDDSKITKHLRSIPIGEIGKPLEVDGYIYVFRVLDRRDARRIDFNDIAPELSQRIYAECMNKRRDSLIFGLYDKYNVKIFDGAFGGVFGGRSK